MNIAIVIAIIIILVILAMIFMSKTKNKLLPVVPVNLSKYTGIWYEIARLPVPYEIGCKNAMANYTLNPNATLSITNSCQTTNGTRKVEGIAYPVDPVLIPGTTIYPGRLKVKFESVPELGDYEIIYVNPEYTIALVGTSNRRSLWILSKQNSVSDNQYNNLLAIAQRLNFNTNAMIKN